MNGPVHDAPRQLFGGGLHPVTAILLENELALVPVGGTQGDSRGQAVTVRNRAAGLPVHIQDDCNLPRIGWQRAARQFLLDGVFDSGGNMLADTCARPDGQFLHMRTDHHRSVLR